MFQSVIVLLIATATILQASVPECELKQCRMLCEHGFKKNSLGCNICECEQQVCSEVQCPLGRICKSFTLDYSGHKIAKCIDPTLPTSCWPVPDPGKCGEKQEVFYYNTDKDACEQFEYGGCGGNENRFESMWNCTEKCIKGQCSEVMCAMQCEKGFKLNDLGCPLCECYEVMPDSGVVKGCLPIDCMMECPHGKKFDDNGCEICECRDPPATKEFIPLDGCPVKSCRMFCERGFVKDEAGCPLCQCVEAECPEIDCPTRCDYGYERDSDGCGTCTCSEDPCNFVDCPPENPVCKAEPLSNGRWDPTCHAPETQWCSQVACLMECENGFTTDQLGCQKCKCRESPVPPCPLKKCAGNCKYGYKYDDDGCRGCECLPNPCVDHICVLTQVCVDYRSPSYSYCTACPALPKCIDDNLVKRVEIEVDYTHDGLQDLNEKEVVPIFRSSVSSLMYIDDEYIRGISLRSVEPSVSKFRFNLVSYGDRNLVQELEKFKERILEYLDSTFQYKGARFTPKPESVQAIFSSDPDFDEEEKENINPDDDQGTMAIIIGCVVAAVLAILIIAAIVIAIVVTRRKHAAVRRNIAYKKVKKNPSSHKPNRESTAKDQPPAEKV